MRNGLKGITAGLTIAALVVFILVGMRAVWYAPDSEVSLPQDTAPVASATSSRPTRLIIPDLAVNANVQHVGIAKSGNMAVPTNYADVAWFKRGAAPGTLGSAVIAGHLDNGFGLSGVFRRLGELKSGDRILIVNDAGKELRFSVTEVRTYPYDEVPAELIFNRADRARLNLVTCGGRWLKSFETYDERLVIFAELQ